eukprot:3032432-Pyramimonas_sp.AAC.3
MGAREPGGGGQGWGQGWDQGGGQGGGEGGGQGWSALHEGGGAAADLPPSSQLLFPREEGAERSRPRSQGGGWVRCGGGRPCKYIRTAVAQAVELVLTDADVALGVSLLRAVTFRCDGGVRSACVDNKADCCRLHFIGNHLLLLSSLGVPQIGPRGGAPA